MTHRLARQRRDHDERQKRHNFDPGIELLQQAVFLRQFLGIESVLKSIDKRRQTCAQPPLANFFRYVSW